MNLEQKKVLVKIAQELKEEAKRYFLKKYAAFKILEQYSVIKELSKNDQKDI
jgi:hypothetical protein